MGHTGSAFHQDGSHVREALEKRWKLLVEPISVSRSPPGDMVPALQRRERETPERLLQTDGLEEGSRREIVDVGGASESNISGEVARRAETSGERAELVAAVAGGMERSSSSTASFGEATKGEREVAGVESGRVGGVSSMIC